MINNSITVPYFSVTNKGPAKFAFSVMYTSQGEPAWGYSRLIDPGNSFSINLSWDATDITFKIYVYVQMYVLPVIYTTHFNNALNRCYLTSGTSDAPSILRIPCFNLGDTPNNNCCCCCCCCCK